MSKINDTKYNEGMQHVKQAEKYMKTSLFKWQPDRDSAISEYQKAATDFRNAKAIDKAKDTYIHVAELQQQMNSTFHAAKSYEQAGLLCKENKDWDEACHLMTMAAQMFQEHGTPDTAALTLDKAGKMMEQVKPGRAIDLYIRACDVAEIEDRPINCAEFIGKAARLLINSQRYEEAINALQRELEYYLAAESYDKMKKVIMGQVLVHLTHDDYVAADLCFKNSLSLPEFGSSEEAGALEDLLTAYDEGDDDKGKTTLNLPLFKYLDNAFAKLAKGLVMPTGLGGKAGDNKGIVIEDGEFDGDDLR
ncbi:gamma-soluble NSF attachment protein [Patella vulgata]|uniref:gamma-soluble NSF attachment protein n=1 Tax=Patella vulgata TaxID=6465 RepID=UPI00218066C8|nr:gamma-soluble NSF attachment protein [Patella vulgata]